MGRARTWKDRLHVGLTGWWDIQGQSHRKDEQMDRVRLRTAEAVFL